METLGNVDLSIASPSERKEYYNKLKDKCLSLKNKQLQLGQKIIKNVYPFLRDYKIELEGVENIPTDTNVLFLANHSNSHDIFTAYEVLASLQRPASVMVATDCLNSMTTKVFNISNATLLDRRIKEDRQNSVLELSNKILNGKDGVIFGEGTWNLHPVIPMHNIHKGISTVAAITQVPIIPTIFEYVEKDELLETEADLYKKCIIRFGKPITIGYEQDLISQTNGLKKSMIDLRKQIWDSNDIKKDSLEDIDPKMYINHTYLKKFEALGFTYDSKAEQEFLLFLDNDAKENEYTINSEDALVPGITNKDFELSRVLKK